MTKSVDNVGKKGNKKRKEVKRREGLKKKKKKNSKLCSRDSEIVNSTNMFVGLGLCIFLVLEKQKK